MSTQPILTAFCCPPFADCDHDFSEYVEIENGCTSICSKCGISALLLDMLGPVDAPSPSPEGPD